MLVLYFEGWYQCRLATDPDPSDDPRGVSGPTFATIGEPDLDRIIRLQDPVAPRWPHDTDIGVNVTRVTINGQDIPNHPLLNARVELLDDAKYEGRNFIIAGTGREPIDPFNLQISGNGISLRRQDFWDPMNPSLDILDVTPEMMDRRQPTFIVNSPEVAEATGIMDFAAYRQQRKEDLLQRLRAYPDQRPALYQRIGNLEKDNQGMEGITSAVMIFMGVQETFDFDINGSTPEVIDPEGKLGGKIGISQTWHVNFWMGGYDVDTLVAYMKGSLALPFFPNS